MCEHDCPKIICHPGKILENRNMRYFSCSTWPQKTTIFVYFCLTLCHQHQVLLWISRFYTPEKQKIHWSPALIFFDPKLICQIDESKISSHEVTSPGHIFSNILRNTRVLTGSLWMRFVLNLIYLISVLADAIFCVTIHWRVLHPIVQIFQFQLSRFFEGNVW